MKLKNYIAELKRRNVFKSAITYLIAAWLVFQVAETVLPLFDVSDNLLKILLYILGIGFPFWLIFSWIYDITSEGVKKTDEVDENTEKSIFDNRRYHKAIIASLSLAVILLLVNLFWNKTEIDPNSSQISSSVENERKSIAVLPFENRSKLEEDMFFTDGVHDDLLTQISKIKEIKTISRTSVMEYRNTTKNMRIIGEELGVATILEGGVQRAGDSIRINVQLINVKTDAHLWAETYTRELTAENIFVIQSEISHAIASALKTILSPQEKQDIDKFPTKNLAALEAWFKAKESYGKRTNIGRQEAMNFLNVAIEQDSLFALAYAKLGVLTLSKFWWGGLPMKEQITKGKILIEKAMLLDSTNSDVQLTVGILNGFQRDFLAHGMTILDVRKTKPDNIDLNVYEKYLSAQESAYQKAIDLNANNAEAYSHYGYFKFELGEISEGFKLLYKARELNPAEDQFGLNIVNRLRRFGRYEEARQIVEKIIKRKPNYAPAYNELAQITRVADRQLAESLRIKLKGFKLDPGNTWHSFYNGFALDDIGNKKRAVEWYNHTLLLSPNLSLKALLHGYIFEYEGEYNKAFDNYLNASFGKNFASQDAWFRLMELGNKLNRSNEVIEHYQKMMPHLFQKSAIIYERNLAAAFTLGILLKNKGELDQSDILLKGCLEIAQKEQDFAYLELQYNWVCRVYLAMGKHEEALASFIKIVENGIHSDFIVRDPIYKPLYDSPEFQRNFEIMKNRLIEERAIVQEMEANGELDIPPLPQNVSKQ